MTTERGRWFPREGTIQHRWCYCDSCWREPAIAGRRPMKTTLAPVGGPRRATELAKVECYGKAARERERKGGRKSRKIREDATSEGEKMEKSRKIREDENWCQQSKIVPRYHPSEHHDQSALTCIILLKTLGGRCSQQVYYKQHKHEVLSIDFLVSLARKQQKQHRSTTSSTKKRQNAIEARVIFCVGVVGRSCEIGRVIFNFQAFRLWPKTASINPSVQDSSLEISF